MPDNKSFLPPKVKTNLWRRRPQTANKRREHATDDGMLLNVFTWNVEGKGTPEEIDEILSKSKSSKANTQDVICLQEANFPTSNGETKNYKWLCSGESGSAVLVSKETTLTNITFNQSCKQICVADMTEKNHISVKVISCYIPPADNYQCNELWEKLKEVIKSTPPNVAYIVAGDFNAQLGSTDPQILKSSDVIIGSLLYHSVSNENGTKLEELARKAHLRFISTLKDKKDSVLSCEAKKGECYTFDDGEVKSQQDFIIVSNMRQAYGHDVELTRQPGYNHAVVGTKINIYNMEKHAYGSEHDKPDKPKMVISTWNIQGATPAQVDGVLAQLNLPVVCVQDLFLTSDDDIKTDHYTWYTSKKHWAKNVGILVKISPSIVVSSFECISDCLCVADVVFHEKSFKVISCYLPLSTDPRYETMVTQITELIKKIPEGTFFVLAGDFNAKLGALTMQENNEIVTNENGKFLEKLVEDAKLYAKTIGWKNRVMLNLASKITETERSNPHHILVPSHSDLWVLGTLKNTSHSKVFSRWIPFFENTIVCLYLSDANISKNMYKQQNVELFVVPTPKDNSHQEFNTTEEIRDGVIYLTRVLEYDVDSDEEDTSAKETPLSPEDLEKYKETPPTPEELGRILKDFVIFYGPNIRSSVVNTQLIVLVNSFKEGNFGKFSIEETKASDEATKAKISWTCRIKWKGIILAEYFEKGDELKNFVQARKKAINTLFSNLSQVSYTVRGKLSFYNKGLAPVLMNERKMDDAISFVDKKSVSTKEDIIKHIDNFFSKDTDSDLVFGPDFTDEEIKSIMFYAKSINLGYRFYTSKAEQDRIDHMALFKKRSPQYIRDKLIKTPNNLKFYAIPPCGLGGDYTKFNTKYEGENMKEEARLVSRAFKQNQMALKNQQEGKKVTPTPKIVTSTPQKPAKPTVQKQTQRQNNQPQKRKEQQKRNNQPQRREPVRAVRRAPVVQREQRSSGNWFEREKERLSNLRQRQEQQERQRNLRQRPDTRKRSFGYQEVWEKTTPVWQSQEIDDRQWINNDVAVRQSQFADDRQWGINDVGVRRSQLADDSRWSNDERIWQSQNSSGSNQWRDMDQTRQYRDTGASPWRDNGQTRQYGDTVGTPAAKRQRLDMDLVPPMSQPDWRELAPLVIVWPITARSQLEDRPRQVLEENFPTEFIQGHNAVAVVVTLPMCNRTEKKFCLSIEENQNNAARSALQQIVKHSTIIKPRTTYLCDGLAPSFVRYKIPCQTNPRVYIILSRQDTGYLTREGIREIFQTFMSSFNEDLFFDRDGYSFEEKSLLLDEAPRFNLNVRHFGDDVKLVDRYVCVYKSKPKYELLEEVLKMRGFHPKYELGTDRLPPRLGLSVF